MQKVYMTLILTRGFKTLNPENKEELLELQPSDLVAVIDKTNILEYVETPYAADIALIKMRVNLETATRLINRSLATIESMAMIKE